MPITQNSKIQVRSGLQQNLPQLAQGEFGWAIDSQRLFIGNGNVANGAPFAGNTEVLTTASGGGSGSQGPQGTQGNAGATGPQGNQGNTGSQGNQGNQGTQGTTGSQGPQGFQGTQGVAGVQGSQGNQGNQGNQGGAGSSTWTIDDFVDNNGSGSSIFNWGFHNVGSGGVTTAGNSTAGRNGVAQITATGNSNDWTTFSFGYNSSGSPFLAGAGASFSVAASLSAVAFASGPVSFAIFSTNPTSSPNPSNEFGFTCDTVNNGNGNWWIGAIDVAGSIDTGIAGNSGYHTFEISVSGTTATYYIDGVNVGTQTITATTYCVTFVTFNTPSGSGNATLNVDWVAIKTSTPNLV